MNVYIILIPVNSVSCSRSACEGIENTKFKINATSNTEPVILDRVLFELGLNNSHLIEVYNMSDFMDLVNNQEFTLNDYFMSYINVEIIKS